MFCDKYQKQIQLCNEIAAQLEVKISGPDSLLLL